MPTFVAGLACLMASRASVCARQMIWPGQAPAPYGPPSAGVGAADVGARAAGRNVSGS